MEIKSLRYGTFFVPTDWSNFLLFIVLGLFCLLISALLAGVKIRSFPLNPAYWHFWVAYKAKEPLLNGEKFHPKYLRSYMLFLIVSVCCFIQALFILVAMSFAT